MKEVISLYNSPLFPPFFNLDVTCFLFSQLYCFNFLSFSPTPFSSFLLLLIPCCTIPDIFPPSHSCHVYFISNIVSSLPSFPCILPFRILFLLSPPASPPLSCPFLSMYTSIPLSYMLSIFPILSSFFPPRYRSRLL